MSRGNLAGGLLAVGAVLGLLLLFHGVLQQAVAQGAQRREAASQYWQARHACEAMQPSSARTACLSRMPVTSASR